MESMDSFNCNSWNLLEVKPIQQLAEARTKVIHRLVIPTPVISRAYGSSV